MADVIDPKLSDKGESYLNNDEIKLNLLFVVVVNLLFLSEVAN